MITTQPTLTSKSDRNIFLDIKPNVDLVLINCEKTQVLVLFPPWRYMKFN